jgi:hypothetical protein
MTVEAPRLLCQAFSLPKRGNRVEEYEDACAANAPAGRFAVADGAAESSFAALWARLLVTEFVKPETPSDWAAWLPQVQERWAAAVDNQPLPWYAETKAQQGAFATFLGVTVAADCWRAVAVGDTCLFHLRGGAVRWRFPVQQAADFGTTPWLIGSRGFSNETMVKKELRMEDDWRPGDRLWLMTDALAQWLLQRLDEDGAAWRDLEGLLEQADPAAEFATLITWLRDCHVLRNDDVTWLTIRAPG